MINTASSAAPGQELSEYASYYAVIRKIPRGRVSTYGDVARLAGRPTSARRVGYALFVVSDKSVPWWRVLNARGEISARRGSFSGGPEDEQRYMLLRDGIKFTSDDRVDLTEYRYTPGERVKKLPAKNPPAKKPAAKKPAAKKPAAKKPPAKKPAPKKTAAKKAPAKKR